MQKIEPCVFSLAKYIVGSRAIEGSVVQGVEYEGLRNIRRLHGRERSYFFDRIVRRNTDDFEPINFQREIRKAVKENAERLTKKLNERFGAIIPFTEVVSSLIPSSEALSEEMMFHSEYPSEYYFHRHSPCVVVPITSNSFSILAKDKVHVEKLMVQIQTEFEKLSGVTKDFGLSLNNFLTGRKFQENLITINEKVKNISYKEIKNEFEQEVISFCSQITDCFLPNVEISFVEPTENYECDIFIGFRDDIKRIVEPTDYDLAKQQMPSGENLKSQIILRTLDKAQRLGAKSTVIVKGFPENIFNDLKKIAESRGIALLSESNYKDMLPRMFLQDLLKAYAERESMPFIIR